jgi:hypothetical protein
VGAPYVRTQEAVIKADSSDDTVTPELGKLKSAIECPAAVQAA